MPFDYKSATPAQLFEEYDRISKETGCHQYGARKELLHLPGVLQRDEELVALTSGFLDTSIWLVALTERRIVCLYKSYYAGLKQIGIDLDGIESVSCELRLLNASMCILLPHSRWTINKVPRASVVPFTCLVRARVEERRPRSDRFDPLSNAGRLVTIGESVAFNEETPSHQEALAILTKRRDHLSLRR